MLLACLDACQLVASLHVRDSARPVLCVWSLRCSECALAPSQAILSESSLKAHPTPPFRKPQAVPLGLWPLCASLSGGLAASVALGSARSGFEATPVVDADHGVSESRSRRRRGRCCGLWE